MDALPNLDRIGELIEECREDIEAATVYASIDNPFVDFAVIIRACYYKVDSWEVKNCGEEVWKRVGLPKSNMINLKQCPATYVLTE